MTKHVQDRREILLNAATVLFRENGYNKTTVRQLAREAGIKSGSIFHHFDTKEEILYAVIERVALSLSDIMTERLEEAKTIETKVYTLIRTSLEFALEDMQIADAYSVSYRDFNHLTDHHQAEINKLNTEYRLMLTDIFTKAANEGLIKNDPYVLFHFVNGAIIHSAKWFRHDGPLNVEQLAYELYKLTTNLDKQALKAS